MPKKKKVKKPKRHTKNVVTYQDPPTKDIGREWPQGWVQKTTNVWDGYPYWEFKAPGGCTFKAFRSIVSVKKFLKKEGTDIQNSNDQENPKQSTWTKKISDKQGWHYGKDGDTTDTETTTHWGEDDQSTSTEETWNEDWTPGGKDKPVKTKEDPPREDPRRQFAWRSKRLLAMRERPKKGLVIDLTEEARV